MFRKLLILLSMTVVLLFGLAPTAAAQQGRHTVYLPSVQRPSDNRFVFLPDEAQVESAQTGSTVLPCTWNRGVTVGWRVSGPGFLTAQFDYVNTSGLVTSVSRWFNAPSAGTIIGSMPSPGADKKWIRVRWNFSGWVQYTYAVCG